MIGYLIQRLLQAAVVMILISALVFIGVFAVGNPIDVLISPDVTQQDRKSTRLNSSHMSESRMPSSA